MLKGNATARLDDQDTVYAAKLKGILLGLRYIKDDLIRELVATARAPARKVTIFTDNQAAIQLSLELGTNRGLTAAVRLGNHENAVEVWDFPDCGR
ncbi:hypothetical protein PENVUL_c118G09566 [Penicillium vulpinum]|uniref:Uncharacterized protein n=1 Tax=Penicillium vulpinum TaxID=29845 RepID=A0A1V6R1A8_9EURO|nr:hypothetical protein PENVUL_c118G09566 [Penicillium vulpinum]